MVIWSFIPGDGDESVSKTPQLGAGGGGGDTGRRNGGGGVGNDVKLGGGR